MPVVLSSMPNPGPSLPAGCTNVKVTTTYPDPSSSSNNVDITVLTDTQRYYAEAPVIDRGAGGDDQAVTTTVVAQFFGVAPEPDPPEATGWVCTEVETEYAVGEFVKGSATYAYKPET